MRRLVTVHALAFLLFAGAARADTAFMLPVSADPAVSEAAKLRASRATAAGLRAKGIDVITSNQAKKRGVSCLDKSCLKQAMDALGASIGVRVNLLASSGAQDGLGSYGLALIEASMEYGESVKVFDGGIERAVDDGIRAVLKRRDRGPGPWVVINGMPIDVELFLEIDGETKALSGEALPRYVRGIPNQKHVFYAAAPGYEKRAYELFVGDDPSSEYTVAVNLPRAFQHPEAAPSASVTKRADEPRPQAQRPNDERWKDWTLGGALVAGGVLVGISPVRTLAKNGDACGGGDCSAPVEFGARSGLQLGASAALLVTGVIVATWWKPFSRVGISADRTTATLSLRGTFGEAP